MLAEKYDIDSIRYWRTANGNEVDFVLSDISTPKAIEAKFSKTQIKKSKYKMFQDSYPDIPLEYAWLLPFDEDFFRRGY